MLGRLFCRLGWHKEDWFELDGKTPAGPWMVIWDNYIARCRRCGAERKFTFWIDRSQT